MLITVAGSIIVDETPPVHSLQIKWLTPECLYVSGNTLRPSLPTHHHIINRTDMNKVFNEIIEELENQIEVTDNMKAKIALSFANAWQIRHLIYFTPPVSKPKKGNSNGPT